MGRLKLALDVFHNSTSLCTRLLARPARGNMSEPIGFEPRTSYPVLPHRHGVLALFSTIFPKKRSGDTDVSQILVNLYRGALDMWTEKKVFRAPFNPQKKKKRSKESRKGFFPLRNSSPCTTLASSLALPFPPDIASTKSPQQSSLRMNQHILPHYRHSPWIRPLSIFFFAV